MVMPLTTWTLSLTGGASRQKLTVNSTMKPNHMTVIYCDMPKSMVMTIG